MQSLYTCALRSDAACAAGVDAALSDSAGKPSAPCVRS
jgi:hypothetical protein